MKSMKHTKVGSPGFMKVVGLGRLRYGSSKGNQEPGAIAGDDGDMTTMEIVHQLISGKYPMTYRNTSFINHPGWCRISQTVHSRIRCEATNMAAGNQLNVSLFDLFSILIGSRFLPLSLQILVYILR